ncbi:MAG TPA: hypothetical protein VHA33_10805 [Candidatus Angelobacter sp.]|jgi:hypothetical protein|nr:hypothetical protein [Candidatus Angelobacter sp.]
MNITAKNWLKSQKTLAIINIQAIIMTFLEASDESLEVVLTETTGLLYRPLIG